MDEDDLLFLPTNQTIGSKSCSAIPMTCVEVLDSPTKNNGTIDKDPNGNDVIL